MLHSEILGKFHSETIVARHNLAELLLACGRIDEADNLQKAILEDLERGNDPLKAPPASDKSKIASKLKSKASRAGIWK